MSLGWGTPHHRVLFLVHGQIQVVAFFSVIKDLRNFLLCHQSDIFNRSFFVVASEVPLEDVTVSLIDLSGSLFLVVFKVTIVDFVSLRVIEPTNSVSFALFHLSNVQVTRLFIIDSASFTTQFVLLPGTLLKSSCDLNEFTCPRFLKIHLLTIVHVPIRIENHSNRTGLSMSEFALVNKHGWQEQLLIGPMELVIFKMALVCDIMIHNHQTKVPFIIFPYTFKRGAVGPDHFALTFSLTLAELPLVNCHFKL